MTKKYKLTPAGILSKFQLTYHEPGYLISTLVNVARDNEHFKFPKKDALVTYATQRGILVHASQFTENLSAKENPLIIPESSLEGIIEHFHCLVSKEQLLDAINMYVTSR